MSTLTEIEQRIYGTNFLNAQRVDILKKIKSDFKQLDGLKVQLSNGDKSKKWTLKGDVIKTSKMINGIKVFFSYQYYFTFSHSFVILHSKVCINGGSYDVRPSTAFCQYINNSDYIGRLENQILTDVSNIDGCLENAQAEKKKPLSLEQFNKQKERYQKALNTLSDIRDKVNYRLRDFLPR